MPKFLILSLALLATIGATSVAATQALAQMAPPTSAALEDAGGKIDPYRARFGRKRPLIAIIGENSATELTDFVIPYGILREADVADVVTVSTRPGVMTMRPALHIQADTTAADFDVRYPEGADYVIVPNVVKHDDPLLLAWITRQAARGGTILSICDGALVVANTGLMRGHRATAHWATLELRRRAYPDVTWVENARYVADGRVVSSAGISAAIPTSLALVEAIAGRPRAVAIAHDLGVADWGTAHNSQFFAPAFGRTMRTLATAGGARNRQEVIGVPVASGVDEIALALTADAYTRTHRGKAFSVAASVQPQVTRHGLILVPDRQVGDRDPLDRMALLPSVQPGAMLDWVLDAISRDFGRTVAFGVALEFEYPGFRE